MASKAFDSTNNIDVRKFCIDLMPEINQTFTILFPFRCSCRLGEHLAPQSPGREWDPLESLVFYSYWIWSHWKLQGINFTIKKKNLSARKCQNSSGHCLWNGHIYRTFRPLPQSYDPLYLSKTHAERGRLPFCTWGSKTNQASNCFPLDINSHVIFKDTKPLSQNWNRESIQCLEEALSHWLLMRTLKLTMTGSFDQSSKINNFC